MFISKLELHLCKRFSLRGFDTITITPNLKTQMVLGSNGAGKSSLLKIGFTVMPAQASDFAKGGYATKEVNHNGSVYTLGTLFEKSSPEHIFICDGEDLNIGRTGLVQKELIRQHFKMTQEIHDVLTGDEKFTEMSPLRRREWITKLSDTDFTYVLGVFSKVKKGARDAAAVVKHNNGRLITESAKQMDGNDLEMLVHRSSTIREELDILLQECGNVSVNAENLKSMLHTEYKELENSIKQCLLKTDLHCPDVKYSIDSEDALDIAINHLNVDINGYTLTLEELSRFSQHYEKQMHELQVIEGMDEQFLRTRSTFLDAAVVEKLRFLQTGELIEEICHHTSAISTINEFRGLVFSLDGDQMDLYADDIVDEKRQYVDRLHTARNLLSNNLGNVEGRLQHIETCKETGCPQCGHHFKNGIDPSEYERLKLSHSQGTLKLKDMSEQLDVLREFVDKANKHQHLINQVQQFRQANPRMANFWGFVDKSGGLGVGKELLPATSMYMNDVMVAIEIAEMEAELKPIREAIHSIDTLSGESGSIREQYYIYSARITEITDNIRYKNAEIDELINYSLRQTTFDKSVNAISERVDRIVKLKESLIEAIRQGEIRGLVKDNQISLAMVETTLTETEIQNGIINDIRKEIRVGTIEEQAYKKLMDALSPVDGLIAEQISIYINAIIDRMNAVIARVWGYNMAIKPCSLADGDLDYRFPLYTVSSDNDIPDVAKGSDSQIDIVNQAFRLIVYKFLELNDYPLYLDELGRSFDEVHRHNLVPAIKDMIDDSTYSQIFMISHYADGQNSYPNSEIIVLDDSHLTLKRSFNEHVTIS
jgi:energy-coupling factor transporter ATP-binding protein EcfA2